MKRALSLTAIVFLFILCFQPIQPVFADISPPIPPYPSNIYPEGETTQVRMVSETVTIDLLGVSADKGYSEDTARVKAIFHMQNLGTEDEKMQVYFPMNYKNCSQKEMDPRDLFGYPSIREFIARVNGLQAPMTIIYRKARDFLDNHEKDIPCWVHFPAIFQPGKDVTIEVNYLSPAEYWYVSGMIGYSYILETGAGWKGTIGTADIVFHSPYMLTSENLSGFSPTSGIEQGRAITWHLEDFEPTTLDNISVWILKPDLWRRIQSETQNVAVNPQDGEAWGRLGKAYKDAAWGVKADLRDDESGIELYAASYHAYTMAITLKPNDADWHYGFADLLFRRINADPYDRTNLIPMCLDQIRAALLINPKHEGAIGLLDLMSIWPEIYGDHLIDESQSPPVLLFLTPSVTPAPTLLPTATESITTIVPSTTFNVTRTPSFFPKTEPATPGLSRSTTPSEIPFETKRPLPENHVNGWAIGCIASVAVVIAFGVWMIRKR
jgi:hypothetical protein